MKPILHPCLPDLPALPRFGRALPGTRPAPEGIAACGKAVAR